MKSDLFYSKCLCLTDKCAAVIVYKCFGVGPGKLLFFRSLNSLHFYLTNTATSCYRLSSKCCPSVHIIPCLSCLSANLRLRQRFPDQFNIWRVHEVRYDLAGWTWRHPLRCRLFGCPTWLWMQIGLHAKQSHSQLWKVFHALEISQDVCVLYFYIQQTHTRKISITSSYSFLFSTTSSYSFLFSITSSC